MCALFRVAQEVLTRTIAQIVNSIFICFILVPNICLPLNNYCLSIIISLISITTKVKYYLKGNYYNG